MSANDWRDELEPTVDMLRMGIASVVGGGLVFMAIILFLVHVDGVPAGNLPLMNCYFIGAAGLAAIVARVVVLGRFTSRARKQIADGTWQVPESLREPGPTPWGELVQRLGDRGRLSIVFQIRTNLGMGLLGLAAFYLLFGYLIAPSPLVLGEAIVMLVGVARHYPTRSSTVHWIEDQLAAVEQLRQFG